MLRIAIYGSECTGKTTLAKQLAAHYRTTWVPEYAREYAEQKPLLDISDVLPIMQGQIACEEKAMHEAQIQGKQLIICDTIPLSSIAYSLYYNHELPEQAKPLAKRHYDLYLLTDIGTPWQADGIRGQNVDRSAMHTLFIEQLQHYQLPYTLLTGSYSHRLASAIQTIDQCLAVNRLSDHI